MEKFKKKNFKEIKIYKLKQYLYFSRINENDDNYNF